MKKIKIFFTLLGSVALLGFQSCLDYDIPTDDFDQTEIKVDDTTVSYTHLTLPTKQGV